MSAAERAEGQPAAATEDLSSEIGTERSGV